MHLLPALALLEKPCELGIRSNMFMTKRKMKEEIMRLNYRIADLEERLCPCEEHDWVQIGASFITSDGYEFTDVYKYKCRRCGKTKETLW